MIDQKGVIRHRGHEELAEKLEKLVGDLLKEAAASACGHDQRVSSEVEASERATVARSDAFLHLGEDVEYHVPGHVGQPEIPSGIAVRQLFVIQAH